MADVRARIEARPRPVRIGLAPGLHHVPQSNGREGLLYVPSRADGRAPFAVLFHGAAQHAEHGLRLLQAYAAGAGFVVFAPQSLGRTWDVLEGGFGLDVRTLDESLMWVFERVEVDPTHVAAGGFSDGASYALSIGLANGDLFTHVLAWSPGFIAAAPARGKPRVFISHGTQDRMLPIDRGSRRLVPALEVAGYEVEYREFDGPHALPHEMAEASVHWWLADAP